jgi:hypothetical protein
MLQRLITLPHTALLNKEAAHNGDHALTKGELLRELIKARLPPYELPMHVQEECIKAVNYAIQHTNPKYKMYYRYDNAGNIVPTTQEQNIELASGKYKVLKNTMKSAIEIEAKVERNLHDPNNNACKCKLCTEAELIQSYIDSVASQIKAIEDMGEIQPIPHDSDKEEVDNIYINNYLELIRLRDIDYFCRIIKTLYMDEDGNLDPNHKPDMISQLIVKQIVMARSLGRQEYNAECDRIESLPNAGQFKRKKTGLTRAEKNQLHAENQKKLFQTDLQEIVQGPGQLEYLAENDDPEIYDKMDALEAITNTYRGYHLYNLIEYQKGYRQRLREIQDEKVSYIEVNPPKKPEEPVETDEFLMEARSREMTQLARRIAQSYHRTAEIYFGVNDNGKVVGENKKHAILTYFSQYLYEIEQEEGYRYDIAFLTYNEFLDTQLRFPSIEESEEGNIEYKSTGSHKSGSPTLSIQDEPSDWRVIQLKVRRTTPQGINFESKYSVVRRLVWGHPPLTIVTEFINIPSTIASVSQSRLPAHKLDTWADLTPRQKVIARANDKFLLNSYEALGKTLQAVTTCLILSRQLGRDKSLRTLDLSKSIDLEFYYATRQIQMFIIEHWEKYGWDLTNDLIKKTAADIRVIWQKGMRDKPSEPLATLFLACINLTNPIHNNAGISTLVGNMVEFLPSYGLCVVGSLNRGLPPPSNMRVGMEELETYNRFRTPFHVDEDTQDSVQQWASEYFKDIPSPSVLPLQAAGAGGCIERGKGEGGIGSLISDLYHAIKGVENLDHLPNTKKWRDKWLDFPPLGPGRIASYQQRNGEFAYAISLDLSTEFLEHALVCPGESCTEDMKHPPLIPFGIPERGHKTRVPCLGSGFLNILQQPIRKALFNIIRNDVRCSYRAKGGERREKLQKFLENMDNSELIHSGDLRVSTDNFSLDFNRSLAKGIYQTGKLSQTEYAILLLGTGRFRMIEPSQDTAIEKLELQPPTLERLKKLIKVEPPPPLTTFQKDLIHMESWSEVEKRMAPKYNVPVPRGENKKEKKRKLCLQCGLPKSAPNCYRIIAGESGTFDPETYRVQTFPKHQFPEWKWGKPLPGFQKEKYLEETNPNLPLPSQEDEDKGGIGYNTYDPNKTLDHKEALDEIISRIHMVQRLTGSDSYLTKKGVQMSQAASIVTLYAFNLYADTQSRDKAKGQSLLCGDDSLRAGQTLYIEIYRQVIEKLGGVWSTTKDVVGKLGNGIFTEQHFSQGRIFDIPKTKAVARFPDDEIPGWVKAIQSFNKVEFPKLESHPEIAQQGQDEVLYPYKEKLQYLSQVLPIGVSRTLGGLGDLKTYPLHWAVEQVYKALQHVPDPQLTLSMLKKLTRCLHPSPEKQRRKQKVKITIDYPTISTSRIMREVGYLKGTYQWLYLEEQELRSAVEGAVALDDPPMPVRFKEPTDEGVMTSYLMEVAEIRDKLSELGYYPPPDVSLDEDRLIQRCYKYDVPRTFVRDAIGSVVCETFYSLNL